MKCPAPRTDSTSTAALVALVLAAACLLVWDAAGLDLWVMAQVGDSHGFGQRDAWWARRLVHEGGRLLSFAAFGFIVALNLRPQWLGRMSLRERRWWLVVTLLCLLVVTGIKRVSQTSCPWDLVQFGGAAHYVSHWRLGVLDGGGGHCFPSGHASAAFAYLGGACALARGYPQAARVWLLAVLGLGLIYGLGQMLRGAHYPSHTLWTGWVCWAVSLVASRWLAPRAAAAGSPG